MRPTLHAAFGMAHIGAIALITVTPTGALSQTAAPPSTEKRAPPSGEQSSDIPLSKKLDDHEGVLTPPRGIDPKIHKAPPTGSGDKMPVIVPPGEPGGDQSVQPK